MSTEKKANHVVFTTEPKMKKAIDEFNAAMGFEPGMDEYVDNWTKLFECCEAWKTFDPKIKNKNSILRFLRENGYDYGD